VESGVEGVSAPAEEGREEEPKKGRKPGVTWAGLLSGTFGLEVFECPACGGRRKELA
jgi:hypothetical protein